MAHILEWIKPDTSFTAGDIIAEKITDLLVRMYDFMELSATEQQEHVIESWRDELTFILAASREVFNAKMPPQEMLWSQRKNATNMEQDK